MRASFESFRGITCPVPRPPSKSVLHGYLVRVSNNGKLWSKTQPLVVHDGKCLYCNASRMECFVKVGKYENAVLELQLSVII